MRHINGIPVLDTLEELVSPAHTAVLCVDVQNDFCHKDGHFARHGKTMDMVYDRLGSMVSFVAGAQAHQVPVAFIQQSTLPDNQSDSPAWLRFKTRDGKSTTYTEQGGWGWQLVDPLCPGVLDWRVEKFRPDAFHQTNLDLLLRAKQIKTVVVLGTITEGCVESTIRAASYHDYYVVVVQDAIASPNKDLHEGSMRLFRNRFVMADAQDLLRTWGAGRQRVAG
jgi:ureidoacrylate peracid hydrolase